MRLNIKGHVSFICSRTHHVIKQYVLSLLAIGYVKPIFVGKELFSSKYHIVGLFMFRDSLLTFSHVGICANSEQTTLV